MIFESNGKEYELQYRFRALRRIEQDFSKKEGKPVKISDLDKITTDDSESLLIMFRAGLLHHNKDISIDEAEEILDSIDCPNPIQQMSVAMEKGFSEFLGVSETEYPRGNPPKKS